jgi:hypothetical protein
MKVSVYSKFLKGMNQDIAVDKQQHDFYYYMLNGSIVSDKGGSTLNPSNIKGNKLFVTIPNTKNLLKGYVNDLPVGTAYNITINILSWSITVSGNYSTKTDFYNKIKTEIESNNLLVNNKVKVSYNNNFIYIYSDIHNLIPGVNFISSDTTVFDSNIYISEQVSPNIIGWETINENIYIFTTSNTLANFSSSAGQIWKLNYNKTTLVPTIELKYNSLLNWSVAYPFPNPGGIIGIYENDNIERLYFTNFYNELRQINISDPNVMATEPDSLNIIPSVDFSLPTLQKVSTGGSLLSGVYYGAYRLKSSNNSGEITSVSPLSNPVNIVFANEALSTNGNSWTDYIGSPKGTNCGKSITWEINNLDTNFQEYEFIVVRKQDFNSPGEIFVLPPQPVPSNGKATVVFSGNEQYTELTLQEFNAISGAFTHCKTIAIKRNILFAGNTYKKKLELSDFDARAIRFNSSSVSNVINSGNTITINNFQNLPDETEDMINPDQDIFKYKSDGVTIGGEGPNISYEFGMIAIEADTTISMNNTVVTNSLQNFRHTNQNYTTGVINTTIKDKDNNNINLPLNSINESTKFVYYSSAIRGYQREETYRFAFNGFNKSKDPYFAKWIGDIKFPSVNDVCPSGNCTFLNGTTVPGINDYRLSFVYNNKCYVNHLYIKFTVNIPSNVKEKLSGYNIVRVERKDNERSILGCGLLTQTQFDGNITSPAGNILYLPHVGLGVPASKYLNCIGDGGTTGDSSRYLFLFDSPDHQLVENPNFQSGDKIKIIGRLNHDGTLVSLNNSGGTISLNDRYRMIKYYSWVNTYNSLNDTKNIEQIFPLNFGGLISDLPAPMSGFKFRNYIKEISGGNLHVNNTQGIGNKTLVVLLNQSLASVTDYSCGNSGLKLLAYYKRDLAKQYGGNTYSERTLNEYIECSNFRAISNDNLSSTISDTFNCFGGDTYVTIYDQQKVHKFWVPEYLGAPATDDDGNTISPSNDYKISYSIFYPTESYCNPDLREGVHPNRSGFGSDNGSGNEQETYVYNQVYSSEKNTTLFFPKPFKFLNVDRNKNRIYSSKIKIYGEQLDSWRNFPANNYIDVDGNYGEITQLINSKDKLLFFQENSFGIAAVNERALIPDLNGDSLTVGSGGVLERIDYISTNIGSKHQFSFSKGSGEEVFWFDVSKKQFFVYTGESLNIVDGISSYLQNNTKGDIFNNDNPFLLKGVTSSFDYRFKQFKTSFNNDSYKSFTFSVIDNSIPHSFYSYNTACYINDVYNLFTVNPSDLNKMWIMNLGDYGKFYNVIKPFRIDFVCNQPSAYEKVFDNIVLNTRSFKDNNTQIDDDYIWTVDDKANTFTRYRVYNLYQNTNWVPVDKKTTTRYKRLWFSKIQGNRVKYLNGTNFDIFDSNNLFTYPDRYPIPQRIKSNYAFINLEYDNLNNNRLVLDDVEILMRVNQKLNKSIEQ